MSAIFETKVSLQNLTWTNICLQHMKEVISTNVNPVTKRFDKVSVFEKTEVVFPKGKIQIWTVQF